MVDLGLSTDYKQFIKSVKESLTSSIFPWKIKVEELKAADKSSERTEPVPEVRFLIEKGDYEKALDILIKAPNYPKVLEMIERLNNWIETKKTAFEKIKVNDYEEAIHLLEKLTGEVPGGTGKEKFLNVLNEMKRKWENFKKIKNVRNDDCIKQIRDVLLKEKETCNWNDLFVSPEVPKEREDNARKKCNIPQTEKIIGLVDLTKGGSAKNCLVFGKRGIYFHNCIFSKTPGKRFIPYKDFKNLEFELDGRYEISLGDNNHLNVDIYASLEEKREKLNEILVFLKVLFD